MQRAPECGFLPSSSGTPVSAGTCQRGWSGAYGANPLCCLPSPAPPLCSHSPVLPEDAPGHIQVRVRRHHPPSPGAYFPCPVGASLVERRPAWPPGACLQLQVSPLGPPGFSHHHPPPLTPRPALSEQCSEGEAGQQGVSARRGCPASLARPPLRGAIRDPHRSGRNKAVPGQAKQLAQAARTSSVRMTKQKENERQTPDLQPRPLSKGGTQPCPCLSQQCLPKHSRAPNVKDLCEKGSLLSGQVR